MDNLEKEISINMAVTCLPRFNVWFLKVTERIHLRFCANFFLYEMEQNDIKNPYLVHVH